MMQHFVPNVIYLITYELNTTFEMQDMCYRLQQYVWSVIRCSVLEWSRVVILLGLLFEVTVFQMGLGSFMLLYPQIRSNADCVEESTLIWIISVAIWFNIFRELCYLVAHALSLRGSDNSSLALDGQRRGWRCRRQRS